MLIFGMGPIKKWPLTVTISVPTYSSPSFSLSTREDTKKIGLSLVVEPILPFLPLLKKVIFSMRFGGFAFEN